MANNYAREISMAFSREEAFVLMPDLIKRSDPIFLQMLAICAYNQGYPDIANVFFGEHPVAELQS